ncbi:MAG: radical SAM protein, partial [Lentisphaeria bacterium]
MNISALFRIAKSCNFKVQRKLFRFGFNGHQAVKAFEKRNRLNRPFFPAFTMLSITNRCNLQCRGCWVEQTTPHQLSLSQMQGVIDTAAKYKSKFFGILGGEPLFHNDTFSLFENNPQAYFQLYTNGTMLTDEVAQRLAKLGNVTPLISIEGLEKESDFRRGGNEVFSRSISGVVSAVKAGLFVGVTASINKRNFDELVSTKHLDYLVEKGVHYIWYFIYRPCGVDPDIDNALDEEQIVALRQFIVNQRLTAKIIIVDAYWDSEGKAVCPGAMGLSHHIAPNSAVEFCP